MEVFVLLKGNRRAPFGGQDHLGSGCGLTRPLAHGRRGAGTDGRGGRGGRAGGSDRPQRLQTFLLQQRRHLDTVLTSRDRATQTRAGHGSHLLGSQSGLFQLVLQMGLDFLAGPEATASLGGINPL